MTVSPLSSMARLPRLTATEALTRLQRAVPARAASNLLSFYSSPLNGIITDASLAVVPSDDHGFHRGHCVFDTCNVAGGRAFGLTMHLDRLMGSAKQARILTDDEASLEYRESLRSIILDTIAATGRTDDVFVRYWLSVGRGDYAISPSKLDSGPQFFVVAHEDSHSAEEPRGMTACIVETPLKPALLATMKCTNYLLNALVAMAAEDKGAQLGIQLDDDGYLAESAVSTIAIVDAANGVLRSPPTRNILDSTTWRRVAALAEGVGVETTVAPVSEADLRSAKEIINLGGGWLSPIVSLDGAQVGNGEPGAVFRELDPVVRHDLLNRDMGDAIPYD